MVLLAFLTYQPDRDRKQAKMTIRCSEGMKWIKIYYFYIFFPIKLFFKKNSYWIIYLFSKFIERTPQYLLGISLLALSNSSWWAVYQAPYPVMSENPREIPKKMRLSAMHYPTLFYGHILEPFKYEMAFLIWVFMS